MAEEYFIRGPEEETARGPYGIDELLTLAEAGKLDPEYYYFDPRMESWALIRTNEELKLKIFPEKKRLTLRKKTEEEIANLNADEDETEVVRVDEMLAAAEGNTRETRHVRTSRVWQERAASISVPILGIMLLISALSVVYPSISLLQAVFAGEEGSYMRLLQDPVLILGLLDTVMAIFLFLNATEIYPLIRFRAAVGTGFFFVLHMAYYINGDPQAIWMALSYLAFGLGLYIGTLTLSFTMILFCAVLGIGGAVGVAYYSNLVPLLMGS